MSSSDYWKQREAKWQEEREKKNRDRQKELQEIYRLMEAEIEEQINAWYQKYANDNGLTMVQARQELRKTDIDAYSRLARKYCEQARNDRKKGAYRKNDSSKDYFTETANHEMKRYNSTMKISRYEMLRSQIRLRIANAQDKAIQTVQNALLDTANAEYERQAGILGNTVMDNARNAETIVDASYHGATFSERIWGKQQADLQNRLDKAIRNALILGKGTGPAAKELSKATDATLFQASRLISTETARVQTQVGLDSLQASGFEEFQLIANPKCCKECQALDGSHHKIPDLAAGDNAPPMHPNCRCSIAGYVDDDTDDDFDEAAFDEWSGTYDEHGLSWEDWKKQKGQEKRRDKSDHIGKLIEDPTLGEVTIAAVVGRSAGARARNYEIEDKVTGEIFHLAEGSRITQPKNHVMAGKGRNRKIDCIDYLLDNYPGTDPDQWTKEKGYGYIINEYGEEELVELHFYREPSVGMVEFKIKYDAYGNREII